MIKVKTANKNEDNQEGEYEKKGKYEVSSL